MSWLSQRLAVSSIDWLGLGWFIGRFALNEFRICFSDANKEEKNERDKSNTLNFDSF